MSTENVSIFSQDVQKGDVYRTLIVPKKPSE
jgi:hypothetical protein